MNNYSTCSKCKYWGKHYIGDEAISGWDESSYPEPKAMYVCFGFGIHDSAAVVEGRSADDCIGSCSLNWKAMISTVENFGCNNFIEIGE